MRLLITGAGGFIGRHTVRAAVEAGHDVVAWTRDRGWFDQPDVRPVLDDVDGVIHLAGRYPVRGGPPLETLDLFHANALLTAALVEACDKSWVSRVVHASTANVYCPSSTNHHAEDAPAPGRSAYAASKLSAEAIVRCHGGVNLRLFNVYGPGQGLGDVLGTIARQAVRGVTLTVMDDRPARDFIHVRDVAEAFVAAVSRPEPLPDTINIGTGRETTVRELVRLVVDAAGFRGRIISENRDDAAVDSIVADNTLARRSLGWAPVIDLAEGVPETVRDVRRRLATGSEGRAWD